ncbi:MAG: hypothetical protein ACC660_05255 [Acidimicrobiales bacterium]
MSHKRELNPQYWPGLQVLLTFRFDPAPIGPGTERNTAVDVPMTALTPEHRRGRNMYTTERVPGAARGTGRRRRGGWYVALGLVMVLLFAACSDTGEPGVQPPADGGGEAPPPDEEAPPPDEEAPPPEEEAPPPAEEAPPPAEEAPPAEAPPVDGTEDGLSSEDWLIIALLGLGALAIILLVTSLASNHSDSKQAGRSSLNARIGEITGGTQWVHDQGSMDVLRVSDPSQLRGVWNGVRARMVDLEGNVAAFAASVPDPGLGQSLSYLGQSLAGLRGALESNVSLRLDPNAAGQDIMLQNSTQTVYDRRQQLQAAIAPVSMARR